MVNINIYDKQNNEDIKEIKEILYKILDENKTLKQKIDEYEKIFKSFDEKLKIIEKGTIKDTNKLREDNKKIVIEALSGVNESDDGVIKNVDESDDSVKDNKYAKPTPNEFKNLINKIQESILKVLPSFKTTKDLEEYINNVRNGSETNIYTVKRFKDIFGYERHHIITALYKKNKTCTNLVEKGLVSFFTLNPSNPSKSKKIFYKTSTNTKGLRKTPSVPNHKTKRILDDNDKYVNKNEYTKKLYHNLKLNDDGTLIYTTKNKNRQFTLPYNIQDILYINNIINKEDFTMGDFRKLLKKNRLDWNEMNLKKLIYNIQENKSLKNIISDMITKIETSEFDKVGDYIKINSYLTNITPTQAKNWCDAYMNGDETKEDFIWNIQKRFPEHDGMCIRVIMYNIDNNELMETWKVEKDMNDIWVENNPSKRRNIIMNGGIM